MDDLSLATFDTYAQGARGSFLSERVEVSGQA
jgi:hypothetical protein